MGEGEGTEGEETDEHASRSVARQDGGGPRSAETCAHAIAEVAQQLYRWTATVCM